jgi:hypothetical protein
MSSITEVLTCRGLVEVEVEVGSRAGGSAGVVGWVIPTRSAGSIRGSLAAGGPGAQRPTLHTLRLKREATHLPRRPAGGKVSLWL